MSINSPDSVIDNIRSIHFVGVCGTAMGAVAVAMRERGFQITGSDDKVYPPMSAFLAEKGIDVRTGYGPHNLDPCPDLVVIGNAMTRGNPEVEAVLNRRLPYLSLPETLKFFFLRGKHNLVVTGTHGKTTTTSLLAHVLRESGKNPSWLIGGIPRDLGQGCHLGDGSFFVLEGDEYDTAFFDKRSKFLHYLPELLVINNIEFDHADIFRDLDEIKLSFRRLVNIVPSEGMILVNADDPNALDVVSNSHAPVLEIGFSPNAGGRILHARSTPAGSEFELMGMRLGIPLAGEFNIRNAAMAAAAAHFYNAEPVLIQKALAGFRGVRRRQEVRGEAGGVKVIDDFGHHPTAIAATLLALKEKFHGSRIWAVFEPRSNTTRRAVFQNELPAAFAAADGVFFANVARLEQLPEAERLDPERVIREIASTGKPAFYLPTAPEIVERIVPLTNPGDVIVVLSNGGFDNIHERLLAALEAR